MSAGLSKRILLGWLAGAALGATAHALAGESAVLESFLRYVTDPVGKIFLRLLFMLVIPLVVSALALGVAGLGDMRAVGRIGLRTLLYTTIVSSIAVLIGVVLVNLLEPGKGLPEELKSQLHVGSGVPAAAAGGDVSGIDFFVNLVPANVIKSMADGDMLAVMVFSVFLGVGLLITRGEGARRFEEDRGFRRTHSP